jgi:hypothetical protein
MSSSFFFFFVKVLFQLAFLRYSDRLFSTGLFIQALEQKEIFKFVPLLKFLKQISVKHQSLEFKTYKKKSTKQCNYNFHALFLHCQ